MIRGALIVLVTLSVSVLLGRADVEARQIAVAQAGLHDLIVHRFVACNAPVRVPEIVLATRAELAHCAVQIRRASCDELEDVLWSACAR